MPILIIGWRIDDKLSEEEQKAFELVKRYLTASSYKCYEYECAKGTKTYKLSDRCFKTQEELLEFVGYEVIEDSDAAAVYARRFETFANEDGNQIKVIGTK